MGVDLKNVMLVDTTTHGGCIDQSDWRGSR